MPTCGCGADSAVILGCNIGPPRDAEGISNSVDVITHLYAQRSLAAGPILRAEFYGSA
jgi:hypothetical protein